MLKAVITFFWAVEDDTHITPVKEGKTGLPCRPTASTMKGLGSFQVINFGKTNQGKPN